MSTVISFIPVPGTTEVEMHPTLVVGYQTSRESGNIVHTIIGRSDPVVTLRPAKLRTGTLGLLFEQEADAWECVYQHSLVGVGRLEDSDLPDLYMVYVVDGSVNIEPQQGTSVWMVSIDYQEIL